MLRKGFVSFGAQRMKQTSRRRAAVIAIIIAMVMFTPAAFSDPAADLNVKLELGASQVELGGHVPLRIVVEGGGEASEPILADVSGLDVIFQGRAQSVQIINMSVTTSKVFTYVVIPQQAGVFTIGPARVESKGGTVQSNSVTLKVSETKPSQQGSPPVSGGKNFIIEAGVDDNKPYVGQQVTLSLRFARSADARIRNAGYDLPDLPDFWTEGIETRREYSKNIGGSNYLVTEIAIPLFPINEGEVKIDPIQVKYEELVVDEHQPQTSFFNDPFGRNPLDDDFFKLFRSESIVKRSASTAPISLHVKPLPTQEKPAGFKGGVGKFSLTARLSNEEIKAGESATLTLTLSGEGNIRDLADPTLQMDSMKIYSDTPTINVKNYHDKVVGEKVYKLALVPQEAGRIDIPEVMVPYFNPESQRYEMASSGPLKLNVVPAEKETLVLKKNIGVEKGSAAGAKENILPIHERIGEIRNSSLQTWLRRIRPLAYPLPLLFYAVSFVVAKRRERLKNDMAYRRSKLAARTAELHVAEAEDACNEKNWNEVFSRCSKAITEYLAGKLNVPSGGLTTADIKKTLHSRGIPEKMVTEVTDYLEACDYGRFALPQKSSAIANECINRARQLLDRLEQEEAFK
jgi:hypothetical protein